MVPGEYFFVSDLHIGGEEQLKILDFEDEFVEFLKSLEEREVNTEHVIIGDAFGLWEFTTAEGGGEVRCARRGPRAALRAVQGYG
jgi:UDP-2,3-diacylglucosamine pyrophosphatase LpxH